jgi:hypothetical protein
MYAYGPDLFPYLQEISGQSDLFFEPERPAVAKAEPLRLEGITIAADDIVPIKADEARLVKTAQEAFAFSEKVHKRNTVGLPVFLC